MLELIKEIVRNKPDTVVVGGTSEWLQGIKESTVDIDICVTDLQGLENIGTLIEWTTQSATSISGKRAGIEGREYVIDIFIEDTLPEYIEISGIKCETLSSLLARYDKVIESITDPNKIHFKNKQIESRANLRSKMGL